MLVIMTLTMMTMMMIMITEGYLQHQENATPALHRHCGLRHLCWRLEPVHLGTSAELPHAANVSVFVSVARVLLQRSFYITFYFGL